MSSSPLSAAVGFFVRAVDEISSRLDFASAAPGPHWNLGGRLHGLECLSADLKSVAAGCGLDGAELYRHAHQLKEDLATAVHAHDDGKLDPWRSSRDRVREHLGILRASFETAPLVDPVKVDQPARPEPSRNLKQAQGKKGEEGEKSRPTGGRPRNGEGEGRMDQAAWWRDHADVFEEIRNVDIGDDPARLFELLTEYGIVSLRDLGREPVPSWWPEGPDGRPVSVVRFRDEWKVKPDTFKKNLQRHDNARARPVAHRHHQDNVQPAPEPLVRVRRVDAASAATREIEDAMELVAELVVEPHRRDEIIAEIRKELSARGHWADADVDHLCELVPEEITRTLQRRLDRIEKAMQDVVGGTKSRR